MSPTPLPPLPIGALVEYLVDMNELWTMPGSTITAGASA